ncbi:Zn-ribbon domain-containing OB-fold protein [Paenibacillus wynnii]|uniref:ChsH2 rubredoxin-like zinc ribbon domain-containing protein n=1 Tax=Paenibacillus wynnii TaxID=268407 RepID=A0A098M8I4_9BACL|nr:zinc ribbon domain-containing protein [Paenibacillus wynnii]KGE18860.1 hypothetical protein PWYN_05430 [Paenibacillus wynnii]
MFKLRPILKTYYDALEEGKVLGMKCQECGDVVWRPLPTCQKCGSTDLEWFDMGDEATIDEIIFENTNLKGDYTFAKANQNFVNKEPYCICVGHFEGGNLFHAALYGVNEDNVDEKISMLPITAKVEFIQMDGGFKSVGFRIKD